MWSYLNIKTATSYEAQAPGTRSTNSASVEALVHSRALDNNVRLLWVRKRPVLICAPDESKLNCEGPSCCSVWEHACFWAVSSQGCRTQIPLSRKWLTSWHTTRERARFRRSRRDRSSRSPGRRRLVNSPGLPLESTSVDALARLQSSCTGLPIHSPQRMHKHHEFQGSDHPGDGRSHIRRYTSPTAWRTFCME